METTETNSYDAYLASGWFSPEQIERVEQARAFLTAAGVSFYDPQSMCLCPPDATDDFATYVLNENLKQIREANFVYACITGRDLGTVFEVGYARAQGKPIVFDHTAKTLRDVVALKDVIFWQLLDADEVDRPYGSTFIVCNTAGKDPVQVALAGFAYGVGMDVIYYCEGLPAGNQFNLMLAKTALAVCTTKEDLQHCVALAEADADWSRPYAGLIE